MNVKQVIVMRKDLNMRKGKIAAQAAHASMKVFFDRMTKVFRDDFVIYGKDINVKGAPVKGQFKIELTPEMEHWKEGPFTKVCVYVNSEEELLDIVEKAKGSGLPVALITDSGKTEFNGVPTNTCCAIGPDLSEKIDEITGKLTLY